MGGMGSGNRWQTGKRTTGEMQALDVRGLQRADCLQPGKFFLWEWKSDGESVGSIGVRTEVNRVVLIYRSRRGGGAWKDKEISVRLDWTGCHLGGRRPWFLCPYCERRVAVLYGGEDFACRHCHRLVYGCQRETFEWRMQRKAAKTMRRLGWKRGALNEEKPKGMHWRTFERLVQEHKRFNAAAWFAIARRYRLDLPAGG
jgi:hypothetical protein